MHGIGRVFRMRVVAHPRHVHHGGEHGVGWRAVEDAQHNRPKSADLMLGRHWAALPRTGVARAAVIDETQPLPFGIFEIECQPAVAPGDLAVANCRFGKPVFPPAQSRFTRNTQRRATDAVVAVARRQRSKIEERQVGAGPCQRVGIEQVVGADIILVDCLLDEPHAERAGIERDVAGCVRGNRREVVDAGQLHGEALA
jgi:hypothetical protein